MGWMEGAPCTCCPAQGSRSPFTTQLRAAELRVLSTAGTLEALGDSWAQLSTRHRGNGRPHPAEVVLRNRQVASLHPAALQQQRPVTGRGSCSTGQPPAASRRDTRSAAAPLLQPPPGTGSRGPCSQVPPCGVRPAAPRPALWGRAPPGHAGTAPRPPLSWAAGLSTQLPAGGRHPGTDQTEARQHGCPGAAAGIPAWSPGAVADPRAFPRLFPSRVSAARRSRSSPSPGAVPWHRRHGPSAG